MYRQTHRSLLFSGAAAVLLLTIRYFVSFSGMGIMGVKYDFISAVLIIKIQVDSLSFSWVILSSTFFPVCPYFFHYCTFQHNPAVTAAFLSICCLGRAARDSVRGHVLCLWIVTFLNGGFCFHPPVLVCGFVVHFGHFRFPLYKAFLHPFHLIRNSGQSYCPF